jgi:hypothetical protein
MGVCISITTIRPAGASKGLGWWYKGNRNVACRIGYVCWKRFPSDSNSSETLKDDSGKSHTYCTME